MQAGPVADDPPPPGRRGRPLSRLTEWMLELQPGQNRLILAPPGMALTALQVRIAHRGVQLWGKGGHITRREGEGVRVWRLTEDQRAALMQRVRVVQRRGRER